MTKTIEEKFNSLYDEVAKYYHLDHKVKTGISKLNFIRISDFGYTDNEAGVAWTDNADNILVHLEEFFPHIAPFYKYFHREHFCVHFSKNKRGTSADFLKDINKVIKKIRKER